MDREEYLMSLLGFQTREELIQFLNEEDRPTGNMVPPGQIEREMQILIEGKEEIHRLFLSLDGESRREIDAGIADKLLKEEQVKDDRQIAGLLKAEQAVRTKSLDAVYRVCEGLTQQATELGLGKAATPEDFFQIEQKILKSAPPHRTLEESQFLARMRVVRAAAHDQVLGELAELTAAEFHAQFKNSREGSAELADCLSSEAEDPQKGSDQSLTEVLPRGASTEQDSASSYSTKPNAGIDCVGPLSETCGERREDDRWREAVNDAWNELIHPTAEEPKAEAPVIGEDSEAIRALDIDPLQIQPEADHSSVRRLRPFLLFGAIVGGWFFSPFNAVPALALLAVALIVGFKTLRKRSCSVFLKSALLFLVLFVPTGMIHDEFFDHPAALCSDGTYSYSHHRAGTCSSHQGVLRWQPKRKHWWQHGAEYSSSGTPSSWSRRRKVPSVLR